MKMEQGNNLEVNFISKDRADSLDALDRNKLWLMEADAVIETWVSTDNETVVRKYANGWQEIRGWRNGGGSSTITYPFPFVDTHYTLMLCNLGAGYAYFSGNTVTGATIATGGTSNGVIWHAMGQGTM
jgi:hypothetical protein